MTEASLAQPFSELHNVAPSQAVSYLRALTPKVIRHELANVLSNPKSLSHVASSSYLHDNGFYKIVLRRNCSSSLTLRLHFWSGRDYLEGNVHNHRWRFSSLILHGKIVEEIFSMCPGGNEHRYRYRNANESPYSLRHVSRARLRLLRTNQWLPGQVYERTEAELHRVSVRGSKPTATLVVCHPKTRDESDVVSVTEALQEIHTTNPALAGATVEKILSQTLSILGTYEASRFA